MKQDLSETDCQRLATTWYKLCYYCLVGVSVKPWNSKTIIFTYFVLLWFRFLEGQTYFSHVSSQWPNCLSEVCPKWVTNIVFWGGNKNWLKKMKKYSVYIVCSRNIDGTHIIKPEGRKMFKIVLFNAPKGL